ncbi:protein SCO1/2 [Bradyrhizobium sp. USDA 4369]
MRRWSGTSALLAVALAFMVVRASATERDLLDPASVMAQGRQAIGRTIGDHVLIDAAGKPLALRDYRGKPLVISLVYTSCSSVCPATTQHMIDAVTEAGRVFGSDRFAVLTVGFDARNDTPARLTQFAATQGIKLPNWRLASGSAATIAALLDDLGFSFRAAAGGFDHPAQTTIVDRDGRVYRHVYGDEFPLQMFMEPMKDVVFGTATSFSFAGIADRIRFICTAYDPGLRRYRIDYGLVLGGTMGALSLVVMAGLIAREWLRSARLSDAGKGPRGAS